MTAANPPQQRSTRKRALWRSWASSAVRQSVEARRAEEPEIARAFLCVAQLCADAGAAAVRAER